MHHAPESHPALTTRLSGGRKARSCSLIYFSAGSRKVSWAGVLLLVTGCLVGAYLLAAEARFAALRSKTRHMQSSFPAHKGSLELTTLLLDAQDSSPHKRHLFRRKASSTAYISSSDQPRAQLFEQADPTGPHHGIVYEGQLIDAQPAKQDSAAACKGACQQRQPFCTLWQWCSSPTKCGHDLHKCVLKHADQPTQPKVSQSGPEVPWVSGLVVCRNDLPALYALRDMDLVESSTMWLGVRRGAATLSTLSPKAEPWFSYAAPHDLRAMNRSSADYHHLGDMSLRVRLTPSQHKDQGQNDYQYISTVQKPRWGVKLPPPAAARPLDSYPEGTHERGVRVFAHVDLTPHLPKNSPVTITRWIEVPQVQPQKGSSSEDGDEFTEQPGGADRSSTPRSALLDNEVRMYWNLSHSGTQPLDVELGSLALSMPFDQIFAERTLEQVAVQCSFVEAYPGGPLGYIQITKAHGGGPTLLVLPAPDTATSFEAWRPLREYDASAVGFGFEGHHEMLVHFKAWAEHEWAHAQPFVPPTAGLLRPGDSLVVGVRFILAAKPHLVEEALLAAGVPVVVGVPGLVLHADMESAQLYIKHPPGMSLGSVQATPEGPVTMDEGTRWGFAKASSHAQPATEGTSEEATVRVLSVRASFATSSMTPSALANETAVNDPAAWAACDTRYTLGDSATTPSCPSYVGRVRLQLRHHAARPVALRTNRRSSRSADLVQYVHLLVLPPARALVRQYGLTSSDPKHGWLPKEANDPWGRSPAFMGYDNEKQQALMFELRSYMAGLSDESGAAQPLAMAIKQLGLPSHDQVSKLEAYVHETLYTPEGGNRKKHIQDHTTYAVRASLLYNGSDPAFAKAMPDFVNMCGKANPYWQICWDEKRSLETWRAYNYPHVAAVYWALYRLARVPQPPLATRAPWQWYLKQAVETMHAMWSLSRGYGKWGLMVGSVFREIARDVRREGWAQEQQIIDTIMKERLGFWQSLTFPFGSEMSWDNTGHEEIAAWLSEAGDEVGQAATVRAVTAYMGLYPSWALAGSARRWWDFFINGKQSTGNERVYHHYAAALNAMPLAEYYRKHPEFLFLLRLSTAGTMGSLSNILPNGGASMGWHGDPANLKMDGYSADYGIGFYGHWSQASGTLACDSMLGWLCFNCDLLSFTHPPDGLSAYWQPHAAHAVCTQKPRLSLGLRDAFRRQLFLAPIALLITVDNAWITGAVEVDFASGTAVLTLSAHDLTDGAGPDAALTGEGARGVNAVLTLECTAPRGSSWSLLSLPNAVCGAGPPPTESHTALWGSTETAVRHGRAGKPVACVLAGHRGPNSYVVPIDDRTRKAYVVLSWQMKRTLSTDTTSAD